VDYCYAFMINPFSISLFILFHSVRFCVLRCVYQAVMKERAYCSDLAVIKLVRSTDLLTLDFVPDRCLKADPIKCYYSKSSSTSSPRLLFSQRLNSEQFFVLLFVQLTAVSCCWSYFCNTHPHYSLRSSVSNLR
jgi:hypothetical protein